MSPKSFLLKIRKLMADIKRNPKKNKKRVKELILLSLNLLNKITNLGEIKE